MSTDRETTRIVRSWLEEGVTALPDRVLDAVLDQVPATAQRRSWWPARRSDMNTQTKALLAVAAALVAAVVGYQFLPSIGPGGRPTPSPPIAPPASPTQPPPMPTGSVPPGTYTMQVGTDPAFIVTVPDGWSRDSGDFVSRGQVRGGTGVGFTTWTVTHLYADSCHWQGNLMSVSELRNALPTEIEQGLTDQMGHTTTGPIRMTIGGLDANRFTLTVDKAFDPTSCDEQFMRLWPDPGPDESGGWPIFPGQSTTVWVLQEVGEHVVALAVQHADSASSELAELQAVIESVRFVP